MQSIVKITDYMSEDLISLDLKSKNKDEVLKELAELISNSDKIVQKNVIYKALLDRENLGSTGIGKKVAIPHAKTEGAKSLTIAFGVHKEGVDFKSMDKEKVKLFFVFASPIEESQTYLKILARISRIIRSEAFRDKLLSCKTNKEILEAINQEEAI